MASLKEVKGRIASVDSTRKITSAMKMVASAKLHKAQAVIENMLPYQKQLSIILRNLLSAEVDPSDSPYTAKREVNRVAIVVFSSNTSLCGGFNANIIRKLNRLLDKYKHLPKEAISIYPIGKKVTDAVIKAGYTPCGDYTIMADKPSYQAAATLAEELMKRYATHKVDRVEMIYNHFCSLATQVLTCEAYLPLRLEIREITRMQPNYIIEPTAPEVLEKLLPKVLKLNLYTALLDSNASEHAARTMAMQVATENATEMLQDLTVLYNKSRQQAITNELLDIIGGSMK